MRYGELNPDILSSFSRFFLSDVINIFINFYLGVIYTLDVIQKFQVILFAFPWSYFDLVGISFNSMHYLIQRIDRLNHYNLVVFILCNVYGNRVSFECAVTSNLSTVTIRDVRFTG